MATLYLDPVGGNDSNDGTSFANRVKTVSGGITAARTAPGDVIRIMASPEPTLVDSAASWTYASPTVTLQAAVTANIDRCESAWTASANVTASASATYRKEGSYSAALVIATAFTTGKVGYFATGALNLSGYQQVSFWFRVTAALAANVLALRLCSDTVGDTVVHTVNIPAMPLTSQWTAVTVDFGSALSSNINSISVSAASDPGVVTLYLDNILACKASSSADSLTLDSLIGKDRNLSWVASTSYAQNSVRRPTQANRNGMTYKVTTAGGGTSGSSEPTWPLDPGATVTDNGMTWECLDVEETWLAIKSINGTTVIVDNDTNSQAGAGRGYSGDTATAPMYKREPFVLRATATNAAWAVPQEDGTVSSRTVYSGGWSPTDMSSLTGETWISGAGFYGYFLSLGSSNAYSNIEWKNLHCTRFVYGWYPTYVHEPLRLTLCSANNCYQGIVASTSSTAYSALLLNGMSVSNCELGILYRASLTANGLRLDGTSGSTTTATLGAASPVISDGSLVRLNRFSLRNNYAAPTKQVLRTSHWSWGTISAISAQDSAPSLDSTLYLNECVVDDLYDLIGTADGTHLRGRICSQNHNRVAGAVVQYAYNTIARTTTVQRHTASGFAWELWATDSSVGFACPARLVLARIYCAANTQKTVSIWVYREYASALAQLAVLGGQIKGVPNDVITVCAPSINTWAQYSLQFTPTAAGVVEIEFQWLGSGSIPTRYVYIDDLSVS